MDGWMVGWELAITLVTSTVLTLHGRILFYNCIEQQQQQQQQHQKQHNNNDNNNNDNKSDNKDTNSHHFQIKWPKEIVGVLGKVPE